MLFDLVRTMGYTKIELFGNEQRDRRLFNMAKKELEKDNNHVEIFDKDSMITLFDDKENPIEFFEVASVEYEQKFYSILQPVEVVDGIEEDEAVIFEYETNGDSEDKLFKPVFDETLLENIFSLYLSAAADYDTTACGSGCEGKTGGCCKDKK